MALTDKLTAIGDAIREKTGGTADLTLDQMVTEIGEITTSDTSVEDAIVTRTLTSCSNDRVTDVGDYAFYGMTSLASVNLPNVTSIGACSFEACSSLKTLYLPKVTSISPGVFKFCTSLETADIPLGDVISPSLFRGCTSLTNINVPNARTVDVHGCRDCSSLVRLEFLSAPTLQYACFQDCTVLRTLVFRGTSAVANLTGTTSLNGTLIASGTGYVYVPDELVDSYKAATNWVTYADQIKPLSEYVEVTE